jgi:hypothetical protein
MGIGTTAKAVITYNKEFNDDKKYIGFDISEQYCERAKSDIEDIYKIMGV